MSPATLRILASAVLLSSWLTMLLCGWALGGAVHVLLVAALAVFPWKATR